MVIHSLSSALALTNRLAPYLNRTLYVKELPERKFLFSFTPEFSPSEGTAYKVEPTYNLWRQSL